MQAILFTSIPSLRTCHHRPRAPSSWHVQVPTSMKLLNIIYRLPLKTHSARRFFVMIHTMAAELLPTLLLLLLLSLQSHVSAAAAVSLESHKDDGAHCEVEVDAEAVMATVDMAFLCATLDWYPEDRCSYSSCSWDHASILNLNLSNPLLKQSLQALSPLRLRLGGTVQDQIIYDVGLSPDQPCLPLVKDDSFISDYRGGCLSMERWVALNNLFAETGVLVAFGLNALFNRSRLDSGEWGPWDSSNARDFIEYTIEQGITVEAWELGNELTMNRVVTSIPGTRYAQDMKQLRAVVDSLYKDTDQKPLVVAPDGTGNVAGNEYTFYVTLLNESGPGVVDAVTRHIYNLGPGNSEDLVERILNASVLDNDLGNYRAIQNILKSTAPWAVAWVGEAGGAYNSGKNLVSNAFVNSFWYLDQLAMAATFNVKAYCRQTLIGGNYGLLNSTTFRPNPDLYSAILWKRLMGATVLATTVSTEHAHLRAYTHCEAHSTSGGVTVLLLNLSNSTVSVSVNLAATETHKKVKLIPHKGKEGVRHEYHLSGELHSQTALLNGAPLDVTEAGALPDLDVPLVKENSGAVSVKGLSIVFVVVPDARALVCLT